MKCFYHNDLDGACSAAVVNHANHDREIEFIEMAYGDKFPWDRIKEDEEIIIVDFSLQPYSDFEKLLDITPHVTWIDHHKSAIDALPKLRGLPGLRRVHGEAACELAWEFYFPTTDMPEAIALLGDYDTWKFAFGEKTKQFQSGMKVQDTRPNSKLWQFLFGQFHSEELIRTIRRDGETINMFIAARNVQQLKTAYEVEFEGMRGLVCNAWNTGCTLFNSIKDIYKKYDFVSTIFYNGDIWTVSLYTENHADMSVIAAKYGGGGHMQAAGFECKELPFKKKGESNIS